MLRLPGSQRHDGAAFSSITRSLSLAVLIPRRRRNGSWLRWRQNDEDEFFQLTCSSAIGGCDSGDGQTQIAMRLTASLSSSHVILPLSDHDNDDASAASSSLSRDDNGNSMEWW
ncbi:hypothetical protein AAHE18_14G128900 [Arachis hypogaea]